jgi:hypothetical protein
MVDSVVVDNVIMPLLTMLDSPDDGVVNAYSHLKSGSGVDRRITLVCCCACPALHATRLGSACRLAPRPSRTGRRHLWS